MAELAVFVLLALLIGGWVAVRVLDNRSRDRRELLAIQADLARAQIEAGMQVVIARLGAEADVQCARLGQERQRKEIPAPPPKASAEEGLEVDLKLLPPEDRAEVAKAQIEMWRQRDFHRGGRRD
jgi:hypothetical protein